MKDSDQQAGEIARAAGPALAAYERALDLHLRWRTGADDELRRALHEAPGLVRAHVLRAWRLACSRDRRQIESARPLVARAAASQPSVSERRHLAALAAVLDDDYASARAHLGHALAAQPRDIVALQAAHALDYLAGDVAGMRARMEAALPAWSPALPGYDTVLAMHAFGLEESGDYAGAERSVRAALAHHPGNARAHHVMAHVFEMTGRVEDGLRWMYGHVDAWGNDTVVAVHGWWHVALFLLEQGRLRDALGVYDRRVRARPSTEVPDLIDAASLLWRIEMRGGRAGPRWSELAEAWAARIDDRFCSFNDLHATLAFVGARRFDLARRLERALAGAQSLPTRYGESTRLVGLPACRALIALGRGNDALAGALLRGLPRLAYVLGGSHAQRGVLHLALARATERARPARRWLSVAAPVVAPVETA